MPITDVAVARTCLVQLIDKVLQGEEVVIGQAGKPMVRIVPYEHDRNPRDLNQGIWKNQVWVAEDFESIPEEIMKIFRGDSNDEFAS